jgi:DNA-binding transcriptional ArsR family regulator
VSLGRRAEALLAIEGVLEDLPPAARVEALELALRLVRLAAPELVPAADSDWEAAKAEGARADAAILSALPASTAEIAERVKRHPSAVARRLERLEEAGRVTRAHHKAPWVPA